MNSAILLIVAITVYYAAGISIGDYDLEQLKNDPARLEALANCLVNEGECNDLDLHLKESIPEIVSSKCNKCNLKEKQSLRDITSLVIARRSDVLVKILQAFKDTEPIKQLLDVLEPIPSAVGLSSVSGALLEETLENLNKKENSG